jgi:hypothetical protein
VRIVASLEPKLFCGVACLDEKELTSCAGDALERTEILTATQAIYATIIVNRPKIAAAQRLHTNRTNLDVA